MKKAISMFCMIFVISLLLSACNSKTQQSEQTGVVTPQPTESPQTYVAPKSESLPTVLASETPAPETPTPTPMQAPEETMETVKLLLDYLKENRQSDIQPLLTDNYDFDGDTALNNESFKTYISLSEFSVIDETFFGDYSSITVEGSRPDTAQMQSDFYALMTDENTAYDGDINDYVTTTLDSGDYPTTSYTSELTLKKVDSDWKIDFDSELLNLISQTHSNPFAANSPWANTTSREEIVTYITENVATTIENGTCIVINNGNKVITSMSLKLEYTDENGVVKRTAYRTAFSGMNYSLNGTYEMKPGYMWAENKNSLFYDADEYGAKLEKSVVSVFDIDYENNTPFPTLSTEKQSFCNEFIIIDTYDIDKARTVYYLSLNGITKLKISNNSDKTITRLTMLAEFLDKDGIVRSAKPFIIVGPDESNATQKIDPKGAWVLDAERFFPLYHVPDLLVEQDNVKLSVIELEYN